MQDALLYLSRHLFKTNTLKKTVVNTLLLFRTIAKFKPYYLTIFVVMPLTKLNYTTNKILYHNLRFSKRIYIKLKVKCDHRSKF